MAELLNFRNKILDRLKEEKEKKQAVSVANTTPQLPSGMQKTLNIINKAVEKAKSNQDIFKAETPKLQTDNIFTPKTPQFTTTTTEPKTNTLPTNSLDNNGGGSIWKPINQRINNFTNKAKELKLQNEANDQLKAQEQEWQTAIVKQQLNEENPWRTQKVSDAIKDHWDGTYGDYIDELVSYSGDEKADITESIDNEIIRLKNSEEAKNNNPETMKRLQGFVELRNVIDEKSGTRTKSFGRQFSDWLTTGGFLGDIGVNNLRKALGVITGNEDKVDSLLEQQQVKRQGLGGVGVVNDILAGGANLAMNATMAGIPALFSAGAGAIGAVADTDDKVLDYDENGNAIMRDKTTKENAAGLGQAGLGLAFAGFGRSKLGQKFMPSFDATKGLGLKEIVKYGAKELPFAFGVTAAEQGFQNLSQNKDFLDYNPEDFAKAYALNLGQDVGMDLFNYGRDKKTISDANAANRQIYQNALENATTRQIEGNNGKIEAAIMNEQPSSKQNISSKIKDTVDVAYTKHVNRNAEKRLEKALTESMNGGTKGNTKFVRLSKQTIEDANAIRKSQGIEPLTSRQVVAYQNAINNNLNNRIKEGMSVSDVVKIAYNSLTSPNTEALPGKGNNTLMVSPYNDRYNGSVIGDFDGTTSLKSIEPRHKSQVESLRTTKNNLLGRNGSPLTANQEGSVTQTSSKTNIYEGSTSLGRRDASVATEPPRTLNSSISQTGDNVNTTSKIPVSGDSEAQAVDVKLTKNTSDIDNYIKQQAAAQKAQSKKSLKDRLTDTYYDLKHYLVDDAVAHERYIKDADERMNIREGVDRVRGSDTIARQMIEDSGLAETIGKMKNAELEEFSQYLIAKRGQELKRTKGEDFKTGRDDAKDIALINRVGDKYKKQEQVVRDFNKSQLDYAVETGLISKELRNKLLKDNTDYVPMNRVLDDIAESGLHKSKQLGSVSKQHAVQKIEGSDKVVKNPLESMIQNAIRTVNEGERNKVAKMLTDSAVFNERRVVEGYKPKAGEDTISLFVNGKKQRYAVPELVAKEMKNLNNVMPDFANKAIKVFSAPAKALRAGATSSNPVFTISNFVRDQIQTVFTGNLKTNIKGFNDAFSATFLTKTKDGKAKRAELAKNGVVGTEYRQTYGYKSGELVKELQANYQLPKTAWEKLKHPIDTIADVIGKTEYFTRAQQYYGTKNSGGTDTQAAQAARNNTVNFSRGGSAVRVINKIVPFLNAGVQGGRITVNQFKERPVRTTIAMGTLVGVAAAIRGVNTSQNSDLWDRLGDEEKKNNLVVFTDDAHYNPETNRVEGIVKIPMPQMLYPVLDAVNNVKGEAEDFIKLGGDVITAISGVEVENPINQLLPTAVKPFIENAMNKDTFTGREIVSEYDSNLDPEDKGKKYSSGLARKLAEITGIDAPKIDNFIADWGGGMAKDIVKVLSNNPDNDKDGGGILSIVPSGINRRFMSGSVESQYNIQATLAEGYKKELKQDPAFQALSEDDKQKALNRIDTDTRAIAGYATREEREQEQTTKLTSRQKDLRENGFKVENYNTSSGKVENAQGDWYIVEEGKIKRNDGQSARYTGDAMALLGNDEALNMLAMTQSEYERDQEANRWGAVNNSDKAMVDVYKSELDKVKQGYNDGTKSRQDVEAAEKKLKDTEERVKINEVNKLFHEEGGIDAYELEKLYKNTSLTEWREMATSDPETYEKLAVYDEYRTNAGVSGKNGNKNANKYYQKNSGGSSKKSSGGTSAKAQAGYNAYLEALKNGGGKMTQTKGSMPTASESSGGGMRASIRKATLGAEAKASTKKGEA